MRIGELFDNGVKSDDGQVYVIPSMTTANLSVYKKLTLNGNDARLRLMIRNIADERAPLADGFFGFYSDIHRDCLLYTSPSPRDKRQSRMPSSA